MVFPLTSEPKIWCGNDGIGFGACFLEHGVPLDIDDGAVFVILSRFPDKERALPPRLESLNDEQYRLLDQIQRQLWGPWVKSDTYDGFDEFTDGNRLNSLVKPFARLMGLHDVSIPAIETQHPPVKSSGS